MKGLIVEGVTAAGKSTLLGGLQAYMAREAPAATKLFLSEHYTERLFEDQIKKDEAVSAEIMAHVHNLYGQVEYLHRLQQQGKFQGRGGNSEIFVFFERLLGSHFANLRIYAKQNDLQYFIGQARKVCKSLIDLGFTIAILVPSERYLKSALEDTKISRNAVWETFLESLENSESITNHFMAWQSELLHFYDRLLPDIEVKYFPIDTRDRLLRTVNEIGAFLCQP